MRVLVCGDRHWHSQGVLFETLDELHAQYGFTVVIEGEAQGADKMAKQWAWSRHISVEQYPADWERYRPKHPGAGNPAGPIRNREMLKVGKPVLVVAFHNKYSESKGTKDMVTAAQKAGVPVRLFNWQGEVNLNEI